MFGTTDTEGVMSLDKPGLLQYFSQLYQALGDEFQHVANISEECFEDVWHEIDVGSVGSITWH